MKIIDADELKQLFIQGVRVYDGKCSVDDIIKNIDNMPAIKTNEIKYGKWKLHKDGSATCSECNMTQTDIWDFDNWQRYCGCCGANMKQIM